MVEYLLDMDHVIDMVNCVGFVQERIARTGPDKFAISEISLAEMCVRLSKTRHEKYRMQIDFLEHHFTIIPFTAHRSYGDIRAALENRGQRLDDMDVLIAASAIENNLTLVTGNLRHFGRIKSLKTLSFR